MEGSYRSAPSFRSAADTWRIKGIWHLFLSISYPCQCFNLARLSYLCHGPANTYIPGGKMTLAESFGIVAPYYNLALVLIVIIMFLKMFSISNRKVFALPWKLMFAAVIIFVVEEVITVLNLLGLFATPRILNVIFEFFIITLFIYALLLQKEHLKKK